MGERARNGRGGRARNESDFRAMTVHAGDHPSEEGTSAEAQGADRHVLGPDVFKEALWDLHQKGLVPGILAKHQPRETAIGTICECGEIFTPVSAKTWARHASAMVLNAVEIEPAVADFATWVRELQGMN